MKVSVTFRIKGGDKLKHLFHVYECEECMVTFAVEQYCVDQSVVFCPICGMDDYMRDVASGEMLLGGDEQ